MSNANVVSSAGYSIYDGWTLKGKVVHTLVRGELVLDERRAGGGRGRTWPIPAPPASDLRIACRRDEAEQRCWFKI